MKKNINRFILIPIILSLIFLADCQTKEKIYADMVLLGGKVVTVDGSFSIKEAVAVKGNKIMAVGLSKTIKNYIGKKTKILNLKNQIVLPGLIDAHAHMNSLGNEMMSINIRGAASLQDIVDDVKKEVKLKAKGEWIIGGRWDHTKWEGKQFPIHDILSAVSPDNPVYLSRVDGNSAFVNKKALEIAKIDKNTPNPEGGGIIRKSNGEPTGVLVNRAMNIVKAYFPLETDERWKKKILLAVDDCLSKGLTGWHEAGASVKEIGMYKELIDPQKLKMRVYAMLGEQEIPEITGDLYQHFKDNRIDNYKNFLSVRSIKLFFDGALGSRGAAFFEDYLDDPGNKGLLRISPEYIYQVSQAALKANMGVNTHCIGIRGNRLCLEAYIKALKENPKKDYRFRIEHAQIVKLEDIDLFQKYNIIPSMQPTHCTSDMTFIKDRIGSERSEYAYAWRSFMDAGTENPLRI